MTANVKVRRPQRWDKPFDPGIADAEVRRILRIPIFRAMDEKDFPPNLPLAKIIENDARILRCRPGELVVREGDYGSSLFVVLSGSVRILKETSAPSGVRRTANGASPLPAQRGASAGASCETRPSRRKVASAI